MEPESKLRVIKAIHTLVWAVFAGSIIAIPVYASIGNVMVAWGLIGFVFLEVAVLLANQMKCPLTNVVGHYTSERQDNFDIYLPLWLARYNKEVFGGLYVAGIVYTIMGVGSRRYLTNSLHVVLVSRKLRRDLVHFRQKRRRSDSATLCRRYAASRCRGVVLVAGYSRRTSGDDLNCLSAFVQSQLHDAIALNVGRETFPSPRRIQSDFLRC